MKALKYAALSQIVLLFLFGSTAYAEEYFTEINALNSAVEVINCDNPEALGKISELALQDSKQNITRTQKANSTLLKDLGCVATSKPSKYLINNTQVVQAGKKRQLVAEVTNMKTGEHRFIFKSSLMAYFEVDTSCHADDMGGQVNRMEADKDGRLYLKKYLVTSTCVNGKTKSDWKALN